MIIGSTRLSKVATWSHRESLSDAVGMGKFAPKRIQVHVYVLKGRKWAWLHFGDRALPASGIHEVFEMRNISDSIPVTSALFSFVQVNASG